MLDYAYSNFNKVPVDKAMLADAKIESVDQNAYVLLPQNVTYEDLTYTIQEPTEKGDYQGTVTFQYGDMVVGEFGITITEARYNEIHNIKVKGPKTEKKKENDISWVGALVTFIFIALFVTIVLLLVVMFYGLHKRRQRSRRRAEMRRKKREIEYRRHLQEMDVEEE